MVGTGPDGSQELVVLHKCRGPSILTIFYCFSQTYQQGTGLEMEQPGFELMLMSQAQFAYTLTLAPAFSSES